jgi:hypothetical protein
MSWISRVANVFRPSGVDRALDEEITFHIESRIDDLVAAGMTREAAAAMAERQFGSRLRWRGLTLAGTGVAVGLAGALGVNRLLTSLLFGVQPADVMTLAIVIPLIVGMAALACWLPAWRASRLDPNVVLRMD